MIFSIIWKVATGGFTKLLTFAGAAFTWLLKNPAVLFALAFSLAFLYTVHSKNDEIAEISKTSNAKDARIIQLLASLAQARANVATLNGTLDVQSASIKALQTQGDSQDAKFDQLIAGQAAGNATIAKKITLIDAAKPGADKCASAFALVRSSVQ